MSVIKKDELELQIQKLKDPIEDYNCMIEAAKDACSRRRALVTNYYEHLVEIEKIKSVMTSNISSNKELQDKILEVKKKSEEMEEQVVKNTKILEDELKLFRKSNEKDLQMIMKEFV